MVETCKKRGLSALDIISDVVSSVILAYSFQPKKRNIKMIRLDKQVLMQI
ncbi:hypothetical protein [Candidatus Enterovibrio escicola]|nr:hypothetical protein [Candidatus Enterovibrio escacola]